MCLSFVSSDFWTFRKYGGLVFVKNNFFRKKWIDELKRVKKMISEQFEFRNLAVLMGKLGKYHYNKKNKMLLGEERKLYDFLVSNGYNPYTVYRWLLLERVPEDIRFQLKNNFINQKKASKLSFERRHQNRGVLCVNIKNLGMQLLRAW